MKKYCMLMGMTVFLLTATLWLSAQRVPLETIAARGRLRNNVYKNDVLGLEVQLPANTYAKLNTGRTEVRAILIDTTNKVDKREEQYNFSILVRLPVPEAATPEELVSMLERNFKLQAYERLRPPVSVEIEGQRFVQLEVGKTDSDDNFYKSVVVTLKNGYLFGFWIDSPSKETLAKVLDLKGRVRFIAPVAPDAQGYLPSPDSEDSRP